MHIVYMEHPYRMRIPYDIPACDIRHMLSAYVAYGNQNLSPPRSLVFLIISEWNALLHLSFGAISAKNCRKKICRKFWALFCGFIGLFVTHCLNMAKINICNVVVKDNPALFNHPFQFEITFECIEHLADGKFILSVSTVGVQALRCENYSQTAIRQHNSDF